MVEGSNMNSGEPLDSLRECPDKPVDGKGGQEIMQRQSDYLILSLKPTRVGGEKGIAGMTREAGTHLPGTELEDRCQRNWPL
jgi:hypothetical protein